METQEKQCMQCGRAIRGRSDKKFCDDNCRNTYNNQLKSTDAKIVRNINNALLKNRRILAELLSQGNEKGMKKVSLQRLLDAQFQFKYHTHTYLNKNGQTYFFIYEYGYLPLEADYFLLVQRKED